MSPMSIPKPSDQAKAAFQRIVPPDPAVTTRPMFGNLAAFVNGNLFCGLFGEDLFVRVSDDDQATIRNQGGKAFEPMQGRAMTGYVIVPAGWQARPAPAQSWIVTALIWSRRLPSKASKPSKPAKAAKPAKPAKKTGRTKPAKKTGRTKPAKKTGRTKSAKKTSGKT
jgi:TfoX/Sxy family transcriptional regulator of competence genes